MSETELTEYAVKMRIRGDSFRAIDLFLDSQTNDEELKTHIIKTVNDMEKRNFIEAAEPERIPPAKNVGLFLGIVFIFGGLAMIFIFRRVFGAFSLGLVILGAGLYSVKQSQ